VREDPLRHAPVPIARPQVKVWVKRVRRRLLVPGPMRRRRIHVGVVLLRCVVIGSSKELGHLVRVGIRVFVSTKKGGEEEWGGRKRGLMRARPGAKVQFELLTTGIFKLKCSPLACSTSSGTLNFWAVSTIVRSTSTQRSYHSLGGEGSWPA